MTSEGTPATEEARDGTPPSGHDAALSIDTTVAHVARVYDYWLGGKDNFAADRLAGEQAIQAYPDIVFSVRANRAFLARTVRYLAREAGIRQFLDIGTGIPTANNTHEVAQSVVPGCRVVYVDNDPVVLTHARALLVSGDQGLTSYIDADLRDTERILDQAALTLDFSQPIAVMLMAILQHIDDAEDPLAIVSRLLGAVPSGSYLAISHPATDINSPGVGRLASRLNELMPVKLRFRARAEVARFFDGLELVEPGLVRAPEWRPDSDADLDNPAAVWAGVARKN